MHFTKLALITAAISVSQVAAGLTCYDSGSTWGSDAQKNDAKQKGYDWCATYGDANYGSGSQAKSCVSYSGGKIMFRMKNGASTTQYLDKTQCGAMLLNYILTCPKGGYDDTTDGWRPRADPGIGCD
ncbi:hypothetical protein K491DRAFT_784787 [Lophiostoma macrostomum CBS 122681]|uniref:Secreted protein n=1 Tax=Lophiostoma macrostomum CBS 122681 TaxID=1314788 RepID=A0A6A6SK24_9PLEO|nr:hypothetical protein K491DRAFT_784787 [Lophiostoma macrostomum CBS 122681]